MQPSPIQLKTILFRGVFVWPRSFESTEDSKIYDASKFDFEGVDITEFARLEQPSPESFGLYELIFRISIKNETGKKTPYLVDMEVYGSFDVSGLDIKSHTDMVLVNGCSILYSAIREQVFSITSRSIYGPFILPTVNFLDRKQGNKEILEKDINKKIAKKEKTPKKIK
ncbi:protein-export chaperone SecB [Nitrosomonas ureae]|uniref:Preprotein translocase subunit SecB n=1 Tax=Nitrosomonas ureae TaxID=44577 RepID=A0A286A275_9PROT|nr:protein-export chaperone SecB [Nitrosomonas ureae]SOD15994.1 Preprotein translocase subunit SecB [Nitrosomonas ureae]